MGREIKGFTLTRGEREREEKESFGALRSEGSAAGGEGGIGVE